MLFRMGCRWFRVEGLGFTVWDSVAWALVGGGGDLEHLAEDLGRARGVGLG